MGVLNELRDAVFSIYTSDKHAWVDYSGAFDDFEAAHPLLVDLLQRCENCGTLVHQACLREIVNGRLCPFCRGEK